MTEEKMLTVREVASMLGVSEKDVLDLTEKAILPAYKIGGVYLRFKKEQVEQYKKSQKSNPKTPVKEEPAGFFSGIKDFFYFNDFYILSGILIVLLGYLVYRSL